ncbi:MAG: DNA repair protein RecO [Verrucomicrobia bacterium]|nr:DNA repair protein RecO [Verrucomicrobiota bacterium]
MQHKTTSAIILRSIPFKDHQKIVTAFSKDLGLISIIVKGLSSKKFFKLPFCESFCEAELVLSKKRGDLFTLNDGSILNLHLPLRQELRYLYTASSLTKAVLDSQLPEKPSALLYTLLSMCLHQIPTFPCLNTLLACFYLKTLKNEGIFPFFSEEPFLETLSEKEKKHFIDISNVQNFSVLRTKETSREELNKLEQIFLTQVKD